MTAERCRRTRWAFAFAAGAVLAMPAHAASAKPAAPRESAATPQTAPAPPAAPAPSWEQRVLDRLAVGADARDLLAERPSASRTGTTLPPRSGLGRDFTHALQATQAAASGTRSAAAIEARLDALAAEDLFVERHFADVEARLRQRRLGGEASERLAAAAALYRARREALFAPVGGVARWRQRQAERSAAESEPSSEKSAASTSRANPSLSSGEITALAAALAAIEPPAGPILRAHVLPFGPAALPPRAPVLTPTVVPSYQDANAAVTPADLSPAPLVPLSAPILSQAEALGYQAVQAFELVRNEVRTEWYAGALKGAETTLLQRAGNDVDQATLLVALLRASRIPARFVRGVLELPLETVAGDLGLRDPARVPAALRAAGVAYAPVIRGGRVVAVQVEHTWVSAYVPYTNYRGVVVDQSGPTWVPLAPALKTTTWEAPTGVLQRMQYDSAAGVAAYLAAQQAVEPLAGWRQQVELYLSQHGSGTYGEQLGSRTTVAARLGLLPSTLPADEVAVTGESAQLPDALVQRLRVVARAGPAETDAAILDVTLPVGDLAGRRTTFSYLPATTDDQDVVDSWGGLDAVPAYLVRVRPQLKVAGRPVAVGAGDVEMAKPHRLELHLLGPFGEELVTQTAIAGAYQALGVGAGLAAAAAVDAPGAADSEHEAASILGGLALAYARRCGAAEEELAGLLDVAVVRPEPSLALVTDSVAVETLFDLPYRLAWQGVTLDAALRVAEPLDRGTTAGGARIGNELTTSAWTRLSALETSALERFVFEDQLQVASVSADAGLGAARAAGDTVFLVNSANVGQVLPQLVHPAAVTAAIAEWVRLGMTVEVPRRQVQVQGWRGSVWRVIDPRSGGGYGYFIAGGLAGGATAIPPEGWPLPFLPDLLEAPYSGPPNDDPLAAAEVLIVRATDGQTGRVGEVFASPLTVLVRDELGRPVQGAAAVFSVTWGGGALLDELGADRATVEVKTDGLGLARAWLRSGQHTAVNPVYTLERAGDEWPSRAVLNWVDVAVASHSGVLAPDEAFGAIAFPGPVVSVRRTDSALTHFVGEAAQLADVMIVAAVDRFDNPVANESVHFEVEPAFKPAGQCSNDSSPADRKNAVVFDARVGLDNRFRGCPSLPPGAGLPMLGQCGAASFDAKTSWSGVSAGVILGNDFVSLYAMHASSGATSLRFTYSTVFAQHVPSNRCFPQGAAYRVQGSPALYLDGHPIDTARHGSQYRRQLSAQLAYWLPVARLEPDPGHDPKIVETTAGNWKLSPEWWPVLLGNAASWGPLTADASHQTIFTSAVPLALGPNEYSFAIDHYSASHWAWSSAQGLHEETEVNHLPQTPPQTPNKLLDVWGVQAAIGDIVPKPLPLTTAGKLATPVPIPYTITPPSLQAALVDVRVLAAAEPRADFAGTPTSGSGQAILPRGMSFDLNTVNEAELVVNRGTIGEIVTLPVPLPVRPPIFDDVESYIEIKLEVDLAEGRLCPQPDIFHFTTVQPAWVTLSFRRVESFETDGTPVLGAGEVRLLDNALLEPGPHDVPVTTADLLPGDYVFQLSGVAQADSSTDGRTGFARSLQFNQNVVPLGHTLVQGVDLFDGQLSLEREDFAVAGRVPLSFRRVYNSGSGGVGGPLGLGWTHNWDLRLRTGRCGDVYLRDGQGGTQHFVDQVGGVLRPGRGYHGTLLRNVASLTYDFYTKDGTRYHFKPDGRDAWALDFVEDTNGNVTELTYGAGTNGVLLRQVKDKTSGRTIVFAYEHRDFRLWRGDLLKSVTGPGGIVVTFQYDVYGNLSRASREPYPDQTLPDGSPKPSRVESYGYQWAADNPLDERYLLNAAHDEISGSTTSYTYEPAAISVGTADVTVVVPTKAVKEVHKPEGGVYRFEYDQPRLLDRTGAIEQSVTDPRGKVTHYDLNQYGAAVKVTDPLGGVTETDWDLAEVVPRSIKDANDNVTHFEHDAFGNETVQQTTVTDADGHQRTVSRVTTYKPPSAFSPPYVKDRPATQTDRDGAVLSFEYDTAGNLKTVTQVVHAADGTSSSYETAHTYYGNGDLQSTTNPRHIRTSFAYDAYGNVETVTDPESDTVTHWSVRSEPRETIDKLRRVTKLEHDTLGRLVRRELPAATGDDGVVEERTVYDDAARTRTEIDELDHETVTTFDREGRVVRIDNPAGGSKESVYDFAGNKKQESRWFDAVTPRADTTFDYDDAGRLSDRHEPLGRWTHYEYDPAGNLVRETLAEEGNDDFVPRVTEHDVDELGREIRRRRFLHHEGGGVTPVVTVMDYDGEGHKVLDRDPLERETTYRYDELGRLIETSEPEWDEERYAGDRKVTRHFYDGANNLVREVKTNSSRGTAADQVRELTYDDLDRLIKRKDAATGGITLFGYDLVGNLKSETTPRKDETTYTYDARNRRRSKVLHLDRVSQLGDVTFRYDYDRKGNLTAEHQPNGNDVIHTYDALDRLESTTDDLGAVEAYTYDAVGNPLTATDGNGHVTTNHYDTLDRLRSQDLPADRMVSATFDVAGNRTSSTDAKNHTTDSTYDTLDRLTKVTDPPVSGAGSRFHRSFEYDLAGNKIAETDRRGNTTNFAYDALNRLRTITDPPLLREGNVRRELHLRYDAVGNKVEEKNRRGVVSQWVYDAENRLVEALGDCVPGSSTTAPHDCLSLRRIQYDLSGNKKLEYDAVPDHEPTGYDYDERNLLTAVNGPLTAITHYERDPMGDVKLETDPEGHATEREYDARRRLKAETVGNSETTRYEYDGVGSRTAMVRPAPEGAAGEAGPRWEYTYDPANRLETVKDPLEAVTNYEYDKNGNRSKQIDAEEHATSFGYDELDRQTSMTYPQEPGGPVEQETYGYDENGNQTSRVDPKGQSFGSEYDELNRRVVETLPAAAGADEVTRIETKYDANGNVSEERLTYAGATGVQTTTKVYDHYDRLQLITDRFGKKIAYTYDENGNRKTVEDADGKVTRYVYDDLNRVDTVTSAAGITDYDNYRDGRLKSVKYPNGSQAAYTYNTAGRIETIRNTHNTAEVSSYDYTYFAGGNRKTQIETNGGAAETTHYKYDDADRLKEVEYPDKTVAYTYDDVGNRKTERVTGGAGPLGNKTYTYDVRDRLRGIADTAAPPTNATYTYDANGNQTAKTADGVETRFNFNSRDEVAVVERHPTASGSWELLGRYQYDADGLRVVKRTESGELRYTYDDQSVLLQSGVDGTTIAKYDYGPDRLLSINHTTEGRSFYLFDALSSPVTLMAADGSIRERVKLDAWGVVREAVGASANPFVFTGHELDDETGLYYAKARFYDPGLGRFLSEDPFSGATNSPPSLHRYAYARENPTVFIDPTGKSWEEVWGMVEDTAEGVKNTVVGFFTAPAKKAKDEATAAATEGKRASEAIDAGQHRRRYSAEEDEEFLESHPGVSDDSAAGRQAAGEALRHTKAAAEHAAAAGVAALDAADRAMLASGAGYLAFEAGKFVVKRKTIEMAVAETARREGRTELAERLEREGAELVEESPTKPGVRRVEQGVPPGEAMFRRTPAEGRAGDSVETSTLRPKANSQVQENKAAGDAWAQAVGEELKATHEVAVPEITVRAPSGTKTRLDWVTKDSSGNIGCVECKASETAPFTPNQIVAHPEIAESGGVVVGKGKPGVPGGTVIPPTKVNVRRRPPP